MHELLEESGRRLVLKIGARARCLVSNALAIAAVTETLLQVLSKVLPASLVSGAQVTVFGGDTGAVEVASNFVRNCINGFVFLSPTTAGAARNLGEITIDKSVNGAQRSRPCCAIPRHTLPHLSHARVPSPQKHRSFQSYSNRRLRFARNCEDYQNLAAAL
jgi:hypothetical protein